MSKLYLIPSPLGENELSEVLPQYVLDKLKDIRKYVVEQTRTARRFLSKAGLKGHMDELSFSELNEHSCKSDIEDLLELFQDGSDVGLISEAGLPAVADPGAALVELCHSHGIQVVPLVGPSSLMLALMSSGLNGQSFAFRGYLPAKTEERRNEIKAVEKLSRTLHQTQIFIETPYRNDSLFEDLLGTCAPDTRICIAANITMDDEYILTRSVSEWKKTKTTIGKRPCVFLIMAHWN